MPTRTYAPPSQGDSLVCVEHRVEVELLLEQHQAVVGKALDRADGAVP